MLGGWCCGGGGVAVGVVAGTQAIVRMKVGQQGEGRVSAAGWLQPFCTAQCSTAQRSTTAKVLTRDVDKVCSEVVARVVLIQLHLCSRAGRQYMQHKEQHSGSATSPAGTKVRRAPAQQSARRSAERQLSRARRSAERQLSRPVPTCAELDVGDGRAVWVVQRQHCIAVGAALQYSSGTAAVQE